MENVELSMMVRSAPAGGFIRLSPTFQAQVGFSASELAKKPMMEWIDPADRQQFSEAIESKQEACRVRHLTKDGGGLLMDLRLSNDGADLVVLGRSAANAVQQESADEHAETTVKSTLHKIARIVEEQNPGYKCSILLVADGKFVSGAGPSMPDDYNQAIDGYAIGPTVGSCGTAIYWGVPVIVEDIQKDPLWAPFAALAAKAGVNACWSHPFTTNKGRVLGALALYSPEARTPTAEQIGRLRAAAQMTGLAVERGRAEEKLREANRARAVFLANMSHEIRTPLNALIGISDTMSQDDARDTSDEVKMLRKASEDLLELFTGVLELTEVGARDESIDQVVDVRACCEKIFEPIADVGRNRGLQVTCHVANEVPAWAIIDEWAFERAVGLLLQNAVKFTDVGEVELRVEVKDRSLKIRISDTGCGIDTGRLNELLEPFVQGDLSSTKRHSGFGLGLTLADTCIRTLGGVLQFDTGGVGTTAFFSFPLRPTSCPVESASASLPPTTEATRLPILVVEDNKLNRVVMERILMKSGYDCEFAENGQEAVEAIGRASYCGILMDCQMPVMDGYEATRNIRLEEERTGDRIPIIAVTANALADDRALCLDAGMDDYLKKPVRQQELMAALEYYVGRPPAS